MAMIIFHTLLLYSIVIFAFAFPLASETHQDDIEALNDLKKALSPGSIPAGSCLSSWDFSVDPCDSVFSDRFTCGLRCDRIVSGFIRVTEITLDPVGYSGRLSSCSWNFPYLQTLDLSDNSFSGIVPESISNLTSLRRLSLSKNSFFGQLPDSLGSLQHLEELSLDSNHLDGLLPLTFCNLVSLKRLEIQQNRISGGLPNLSSLRNLFFLDLSDNRLSGKLPVHLPISLVELTVRNNQLEGQIPKIFHNLVFLQVLDLSHNKLSGVVPSILFRHPSLQQLTLSRNNLTSLGSPENDSVISNSKLIAVDLSYNSIGGLLPLFFVRMLRLSALSLEQNILTGMIPHEYAMRAAATAQEANDMEAAPFQRLLLGGNYLFGLIPAPLLGLKPENADVSLADNCLYQCPDTFFFCQGRDQKPLLACKRFRSFIP